MVIKENQKNDKLIKLDTSYSNIYSYKKYNKIKIQTIK